MKTTSTINYTARIAPYPNPRPLPSGLSPPEGINETVQNDQNIRTIPSSNITFRTLPVLYKSNLVKTNLVPNFTTVEQKKSVKFYPPEIIEDAVAKTKALYKEIAHICFYNKFKNIFVRKGCQILISKHADKQDNMPITSAFLNLKSYIQSAINDYNKTNPTFNKLYCYINYDSNKKFAFLIQSDGEENYNSEFEDEDFIIIAKGKKSNMHLAKLEECNDNNWDNMLGVTIHESAQSKFKKVVLLKHHRRAFIRNHNDCKEDEFCAVTNIMFITPKDIKVTKEKFTDMYGVEFERTVIEAEKMIVGKHFSYESYRECVMQSMKGSPKLDILIATAL